MASINYERLVKDWGQLGENKAKAMLQESMKGGAVSPYNFDFGRLWEACFGWHEFQACRKDDKYLATRVMEAAGAVTTAAFQQIGQQIAFSMIIDAYQSPEFTFTNTIPVKDSIYSFEKVPEVSDLDDEASEVNEGHDYPTAGVSAGYRHRPETKKRGFKVLLTREVIFFDRTGMVQEKCRGGGKSMGQNREKRAVDCVIDENGGAKSAALGGHRYHYRDNSIATYGNSSGNHDWDNLAGSNGLVDWTDVDNAVQLLNEMTDPYTQEPIVFGFKHLACAQELEQTALRIRNATEITVVTPGYATSGNPTETKVANPWGGRFEVITSPYMKSRLATDTHWILGDLSIAFEYVQNWAPEVKTLAGGTQLEFDRDIVQQFRFSEYGNYGTAQPRAVVESTVA